MEGTNPPFQQTTLEEFTDTTEIEYVVTDPPFSTFKVQLALMVGSATGPFVPSNLENAPKYCKLERYPFTPLGGDRVVLTMHGSYITSGCFSHNIFRLVATSLIINTLHNPINGDHLIRECPHVTHF